MPNVSTLSNNSKLNLTQSKPTPLLDTLAQLSTKGRQHPLTKGREEKQNDRREKTKQKKKQKLKKVRNGFCKPHMLDFKYK